LPVRSPHGRPACARPITRSACLDVYIRIPEEIPNSRFATIAPPSFVEMVKGVPLRLALVVFSHRSNIYRALNLNPGYAVASEGRAAVLVGLHEAWPCLDIRERAFVRITGSGGSLGFADPEVGIGYAYVTSQSGARLTGDPRDIAVRHALYSVPTVSSGTRG
jgi:hypothetical protein